MTKQMLSINNLQVNVGDKTILKDLNLEVGQGEVHVIMGPNGAGKSTLANILMGNPKYELMDGSIEFEGVSIEDSKVNERAKLGMFLSFQYPEEIPGITVEHFLRSSKAALTEQPIRLVPFRKKLKETMKLLDMKEEYASRFLNEGFSGGEKKKSEILQLLMLEPKLAILDETDSGLDIDAIRTVALGVKQYMTPEHSAIIITHHNKILEYIAPDYVHVLIDGKIIQSGTYELVQKIEKEGYDSFKSLR